MVSLQPTDSMDDPSNYFAPTSTYSCSGHTQLLTHSYLGAIRLFILSDVHVIGQWGQSGVAEHHPRKRTPHRLNQTNAHLSLLVTQ